MSFHALSSSILSRFGRVAALALVLPVAACAAEAGDEESVAHTEGAIAPTTYAWGFAWVTPGYPIDPAYSFNSGRGANTYSGSGGSYTVTMNELGVSGGTVQVVSYGSAATRCKVASWYPVGSAMTINVRCHDTSGALVESPFVVFFNKGAASSGQRGAHLYYDGATTWAGYSWNSAGLANSVEHASPGRYRATLRGLGFTNASVHVTAYGTSPTYCKIVGWYGSTDVVVDLRCNDAAGNLADSAFVLSYSDTTPRSGMIGGHAWINGATSADASYQRNQNQVACFASRPITVTDFSAVTYPDTNVGAPFATMSLSTAYGDDGAFCKVRNWIASGSDITAQTVCFTPSGAPTTSKFTSSLMAGTYPGPC